MTIGTPSGRVNVVDGPAVVDVPVSFSLNGGTQSVDDFTLQISYGSTQLSIANTDIALSSLTNGWTITPNTSTPGKLIVTVNSATASLSAPTSGDILELNFHVAQGASGFLPITFLTPTSTKQFIYTPPPATNLASTTTFNTGGINAYAGSTWTSTASGSWGTSANWDIGPPLNSGDEAIFGRLSGPALSSPLLVSLDTSRVVGELTFSNSSGNLAGYRLTPGSSGLGNLTLNNAGYDAGVSSVQVLSGSHEIAVPVTLANNLQVSLSNNSLLTVSGNIDQSTTAGLTLLGNGELILSGTNGTYSGGTVVKGGKLVIENERALLDGSNLAVGAGVTVFAGPLIQQDIAAPGSVPAPNVSSVPEPGCMAMLAVGAACSLAVSTWRQRRERRTKHRAAK
jgi:autotransporter-associated beta strand protein